VGYTLGRGADVDGVAGEAGVSAATVRRCYTEAMCEPAFQRLISLLRGGRENKIVFASMPQTPTNQG
jgi:hypothetical protein